MTVVQDTPYFIKPDAIFPNNWISIHQTGEVVLYPMATSNRYQPTTSSGESKEEYIKE